MLLRRLFLFGTSLHRFKLVLIKAFFTAMCVGDFWVVLNRAIVIVWRSVALLLRRLLLATTATTADCYTNYFCDECKTSCPHPPTGNLIA